MLKRIDMITIAGEEDPILVPSDNCDERKALLKDLVVIDMNVRKATDVPGSSAYGRAGFTKSIHMREKTAKKYGLLNEENGKVIAIPVETLEDRLVQILKDLGVVFE